MDSDVAIRVECLSKRYNLGATVGSYGRLTETISDAAVRLGKRLRGAPVEPRNRGYIDALSDISLEVRAGEVVGLIGSNGAGKSTLLKVLSRITQPTSGRAELRGRVASLLEVGTGFHPELTGRENIYLNGSVLGMRRAEIDRRFDEIVEFAEVSKFLDTPVKRFSSGMYVRLAFAVAAHLEPDILVVDEVLSVGDAAFQRKSLGKMESVAGQGRTVIFVSHNMALIQALCERAYLLRHGRVESEGTVRKVMSDYLGSLATKLSVPVGEREDRFGNGSVRVTSLTIESLEPDAVIRTGCRLKITLGYESAAPVDRTRFVVSIYDTTRTGIYFLQSDSKEFLPDVLPARGTISCVTGPLAVTPGVCYVNVSVIRAGVTADFVDDVATFDVAADALYGLRHLPDRSAAVAVVDQQWWTGDIDDDLSGAAAMFGSPAYG
jgi:homopolymeric O-antigen transport system ATP-binding protein